MQMEFVILAKRTTQVTEDDFERQTLCLHVFPHITIAEIDEWVIKNGLDPNSGFVIRKVNAASNPYTFLKTE